jgi:hypothetical protein
VTHGLTSLWPWSGDPGAIDIASLSVIGRCHFRQQIPIREIERRTGSSRNTIRKNLRPDVVEPEFRLPDRPSKLDPFAEKLMGWMWQEDQQIAQAEAYDKADAH